MTAAPLPKQHAILYLYKEHHGIVLETCFPVPPKEYMDDLAKGNVVFIESDDTGYIYTWSPDTSCVCEMKNGMEIHWWPYPNLQQLFTEKPQGTYTRLYADGSIHTRDRWGRIMNWNNKEKMTVHGKGGVVQTYRSKP